MKRMICVVALFLVSILPANALPIYDSSILIPNANVLINFNGIGLDWVYAGPVQVEDPIHDGDIKAPSYRAAEGWRFASAVEWAARPEWTDFIIGGAIVPAVDGYSDHSKYLFASEYWSQFSHVDLLDVSTGHLNNGETYEYNSEVWYVRNSHSVPEPATLLLFGAGLIGLATLKRKNFRK